MSTLPRRCRSTSTCAWSARRTSRSSSGRPTRRSRARTAAPRTSSSSSPYSRLTAPPRSQASAVEAAVAAGAVAAGTELAAYGAEVAVCTRCRLAEGRTQVVFGSGSASAGLMFVGEAPGFHEDQQGVPFVGQAGKLLDRLLEGIGLERSDIYIANVIKCRPPQNRDPQQDEMAACEPHLFRQTELIHPRPAAS